MAINILHLTDLHMGHEGQAQFIPTLRAEFVEDVRHLVDEAGRVDLVAFTGDMVNTGTAREYEQFDAFMVEVVSQVNPDGIPPLVAVVPGNHDLQRLPERTTAKVLLGKGWDESLEEELLTAQDELLWSFVSDAFANFTKWRTNSELPFLPYDNVGAYPGDFTANLESGGLKVGVLGLNSSVRHFSDAAAPGTVGVTPFQVHAATAKDLDSWMSTCDVALLLTHHPQDWFANVQGVAAVLHHPSSKLRLHLAGHLHNEDLFMARPLSDGQHLRLTGRSLAGLESFRTQSGDVIERLHGYSFISIDKRLDGVFVSTWPRNAPSQLNSAWKFDRSTTHGLARGSNSTTAVRLVGVARVDATETSELAEGQPLAAGTVPIVSSSATGTLLRSPQEATPEEIRLALASGSAIAIVGDRGLESPQGGEELPLEVLRLELLRALGLPDDSHSLLSLPQLLSHLSDADPRLARQLTGRYLGNPTDGDLAAALRIAQAPFADVYSVSPAADFRDFGTQLGFAHDFVDASTARYILPPPLRPLRVRLASSVSSVGTTSLYIPMVDDEFSLGQPRASWVGLARNRMSRSVTFFMTDSPSLSSITKWLHARGRSTDSQPAAYLIAGDVDPQLLALLVTYGVKWVRCSVSTFVETYLQPGADAVGQGRLRLARHAEGTHPQAIDVETILRMSQPAGDNDYLLGRAPRWGDVADGFTAQLAAMQSVESHLRSPKSDRHLVLLEGTAGSGKSTLLMQVAVRARARGERVAWFDSRGTSGPADVVSYVRSHQPQLTIVDDVDVYGARATNLLEELAEVTRTFGGVVLASVRTVRLVLLESLRGAQRVRHERITEGDAESLVELLRSKNAVADQRWSDQDISRMLRDDAEGQLLVGMIRVTTGLPLKQRIAAECAQLGATELYIYGCVALLSAELEMITTDQLQTAGDSDGRASWAAIRRLERAGLIMPARIPTSFVTRHRIVAEGVRDHLRTVGMLESVVQGCLWAFASSAGHVHELTWERQSMIRLLNHSYLISLDLPSEAIRRIYASLEPLLSHDYHYWLQRGSFEAERGDERRALHALTVARTTAGGDSDHMVRTEYAYLRLKTVDQLGTTEATLAGRDALEDLLRVIRERGTASPHTVVILARLGIPWLETGNLLKEERVALARDALTLLNAAKGLDVSNAAVRQVREEAARRAERLILDNA